MVCEQRTVNPRHSTGQNPQPHLEQVWILVHEYDRSGTHFNTVRGFERSNATVVCTYAISKIAEEELSTSTTSKTHTTWDMQNNVAA
jgi:hypothetical protein